MNSLSLKTTHTPLTKLQPYQPHEDYGHFSLTEVMIILPS